MDDARIFPQQYGVPFPPNFGDVVRTMFKRLFRVYAHIYHTHFRSVCSLGEEAHLNTCFKHFMYFTQVWHQLLQQELFCKISTLQMPLSTLSLHRSAISL